MDKAGVLLKKAAEFLKKYKYAAAVLLLGLALMLLPGKSSEEVQSPPSEASCDDSSYAQTVEQQLKEILQKISGAGQVEVMLTLRKGSATEYQSDVQSSQSGEQSSEERKTVILSEGSAYDKAAICAVEYPQFQGALIVCQGAEQASVKLNLVQAVSALTGLSSDQITVVKMK